MVEKPTDIMDRRAKSYSGNCYCGVCKSLRDEGGRSCSGCAGYHDEIDTLRSRISELESQLCRAREVISDAGIHDSSCKVDEGDECSCSSLSSTGPCPHEEEAKRLREAVEWACSDETFWKLK